MCQSIIAHKLFDYVVLAFIFSNCITVALERPKILQGSLVHPSKMCLCACISSSFSFCSFCVVAFWINRMSWFDEFNQLVDFDYFKGALNKVLLHLIFSFPLSDCPSLYPSSCLFVQERVFLTISNYIFTAIFVGEMTLKVTFYNQPLYYYQRVLSVVCAGNTQRHLLCLSFLVCPGFLSFAELT